jgi:hypothetical protein
MVSRGEGGGGYRSSYLKNKKTKIYTVYYLGDWKTDPVDIIRISRFKGAYLEQH